MIETVAGSRYTATVEGAPEGLEGTIGVRVEDADADEVSSRTTAGIVELAPGVYAKDDLIAPASTGTYVVIWDDGDVPLEPDDIATETLVVAASAGTFAGPSPARLINRPCLILRRLAGTTRNAYGAEIPNEAILETVWEAQQQLRSEPGGQGELSQTLWTAFFLPGTELTTADAVLDDELGVFEFVGAPWPARNPRTRTESHIEATVRRVAGSEAIS